MFTGPMASKFRAHLAIRLIAGGQFVAGDQNQRGIGEQSGALDSQFVQASFRHVHGVGLQLGRGRLQFAAAVAGLVEQLAGVAQKFVDLREPGAELVFFELQQPLPRLAGIAFGREVGGLLFELEILRFALHLFGGGRFDLRGERMQPLVHLGEQGFDAREHRSRRAMALLKRRYARHALRTGLRRIFAALAQYAERFLSDGDLLFELRASLFQQRRFPSCRAAITDSCSAPLRGKALQLAPAKCSCAR